MNTNEIMVEGRKLTLVNHPPEVGDYTVYKDKIYKVTSSYFFNFKLTLGLVRKDEHRYIKNIKLPTIYKPFGYIDI